MLVYKQHKHRGSILPKDRNPSHSLILPTLSLGVHYQVSLERLFTGREIDDFTSIYEREGVREEELSEYLREHPKFLFALGAYHSVMHEVEFPTSRPELPPKLRLDFLLRDSHGTWDVVELKKPDIGGKDLIVGLPQRRRFAFEVEDCIAQVRTYLDELESPKVQEYFRNSGVFVSHPQAWLLVGRNTHLPQPDRSILERNLMHSLRIVTYDELTQLAKQRLLIVSHSVLLPSMPGIPLTFEEVAQDSLLRAVKLLQIGLRDSESIAAAIELLVSPLRILTGSPQCAQTYAKAQEYLHQLEVDWGCRGAVWQLHLSLPQLTSGSYSSSAWEHWSIDFGRLISGIRLQLFMLLAEMLKVNQPTFQLGQKVQILEGPFVGTKGVVQQLSSQDRIRVRVSLPNGVSDFEVATKHVLEGEGQVNLSNSQDDSHFVREVFDAGQFVALSDGSNWLVSPKDRSICARWQRGERVLVVPGSACGFDSILTHKLKSEVIRARLFQRL
jgi:hypothetical protein